MRAFIVSRHKREVGFLLSPFQLLFFSIFSDVFWIRVGKLRTFGVCWKQKKKTSTKSGFFSFPCRIYCALHCAAQYLPLCFVRSTENYINPNENNSNTRAIWLAPLLRVAAADDELHSLRKTMACAGLPSNGARRGGRAMVRAVEYKVYLFWCCLKSRLFEFRLSAQNRLYIFHTSERFDYNVPMFVHSDDDDDDGNC